MVVELVPAPDQPRFEAVAEVARSALEHWKWAVRSVPFAVRASESRIALRGLAAWYERMCVDDAYHNPAPADGVDALVSLGTVSVRRSRAEGVLVAFWAVRVAEELAHCRGRWSSGNAEPTDADVAVARLDVALQGAWQRLSASRLVLS